MKKTFRNVLATMAMGAALLTASPAQAVEHVETGRINQISYDWQAGQYIATATPFSTPDNGFVFYLDIQAPYNELVEEALNNLLDGSLVELTVEDMGTTDIMDDQIVRAIF